MGTGLTIITLSILPVLIYSLIIYMTVPYKSISFSVALPYIIVGFMSVGLLKTLWVLYPDWATLAQDLVDNPHKNAFKYYHVFYFIQVALIEEISKLGVFLLYDNYRGKSRDNDHPIATMFHMGLISLGFAVVENVTYASGGPDPVDILWWRSITAVIGHMVFGLFMGYWVSMGRMGSRLYDRSLLDIIVNKRKKLRNVVYVLIGLTSATILHGIYDLHIELNGPNGITGLYMLLIMSLLGSYWCFKNLSKLYNKKSDLD